MSADYSSVTNLSNSKLFVLCFIIILQECPQKVHGCMKYWHSDCFDPISVKLGCDLLTGDVIMMQLFDTPITTHQIKCVLDFLHDGREDRMEKRPGNAARVAKDRISIARSNVRVTNGLSRSRDRASS